MGTVIAKYLQPRSAAVGERRALYERLTRETFRQAYSMAYRMTGNAADAEDLVQETYVRAYRFFHKYDENLPFTGWLYRIMTNLHIDASRKRGRIKTVSMEKPTATSESAWDLPDLDAQTDARLMESGLEENLQRGLQAINPEFRTAVLLSDVDGLSYEEVADVMSTSIGTVRSRIHRGRKQLRDYLLHTAPERFGREVN